MSRPAGRAARRPAKATRLDAETRIAREGVVLDAAADVLARRGPDGFNVRDVAKAAGASTMIVYTLFEGRDGLLDRLWRRDLDRLADAFDEVPEHDTLAGLAGLARAYREHAIAHKQSYLALSSAPRSILPVRKSRAFLTLVAAARGAMERGLLRKSAPEAVADALWALVHGMVSLELGGHFASAKVAEDRLLAAGAALVWGLR